MYQDYFKLNALPFENTPDPAFFFMGARYRETLALMIHSVISRKGLICITGSVGTGKTTLSRALIGHLPEGTKVMSLVHPKAKPTELTSFVAHSLKLTPTPDSHLLLNELIREELIKIDEAGGRCVLIIDEAQFMSDELFQEVLFFTNLETSRHKLIQIFLLGQKELLDKINRPEMRQLSQRISVTNFLRSMDRAQSIQYIKHRLITAGGSPDIFSDEALDLIASNSGGIPRIVNRICDATLLKTFMLEKETAETAEVRMAISDLGLDFRSGSRKPIRMNPYRKQVLQPQDSFYGPAIGVSQGEGVSVAKKDGTPYHHALKMGFDEDKKPAKAKERKTSQSGKGLRSKGLKLVLILGIIVLLVAGIIKQLGMNGSEKISEVITKKVQTAPPTQAITDKAPGQSNMEGEYIDSTTPHPEGAGASIGQDITITQQTNSQAKAPIPNKEVPNKEEKPVLQVSPQKTERPEEIWPDTQETRVTYPYSVLLASYRTLRNMERGLSIYRKKGLSVFWVRVNLGDDNVWYRIFTGHFKEKEGAEAFIKETGLVEARSKKIEYANLVGVYTSENALNEKLLELSGLGYCPYIIKGIKGASHLYAGAFYTKQGAETQCSELLAGGIHCRVVEQ